MRRLLAALCVALTGGVGVTCVDAAAPPAGELAVVRLAVSQETCEALCANTVTAKVRLEGSILAIAELATACGDPMLFTDVQGGQKITVKAEIARDGIVLLSGVSLPVTVASNATTDVEVVLTAEAPPLITGVEPDPVVVGATPVAVTVTGSGLGAGQGEWGATLSDASVTTESWTDDQVALALGADARGDALVLTNCGLDTAPAPLRVASVAAPGSVALTQPPGCGGLRFTALAADTDGSDVIVAGACDDAALGYVQRWEGGDCLVAGAAEVLGDHPTAVAVAPDGVIWVAVEGGQVHRVTTGQPTTVGATLPAPETVVALAASEQGIIGLADDGVGGTRLVDVGTGVVSAVPGVPSGLQFHALAVGPDHVFATASDAQGNATLVGIPRGAGVVTTWSLANGCIPTALAASDVGWVAVACDDGGAGVLVGFNPVEGALFQVALTNGAAHASVAMDAVGDVALVREAGGRLTAVQLQAGQTDALVGWSLAGTVDGPMVRFGAGHHFLLAGPAAIGALTVVAPYNAGLSCE